MSLCLLLPSILLADDNVEETYLYRTNMMEISANHLKALKGYVNGSLAIKNHIPTHVDALLTLNNIYQDLFPEGEQHPESEAMGVIWSDPRGFQSAIQHNRKRIMALKQVDPNDMQTMKRAVNEVRMSCGDCHSYFRER
ncbi:MAG: cytochrome c [Candidatus Thiodiazotropha sp. 6PLUC2]